MLRNSRRETMTTIERGITKVTSVGERLTREFSTELRFPSLNIYSTSSGVHTGVASAATPTDVRMQRYRCFCCSASWNKLFRYRIISLLIIFFDPLSRSSTFYWHLPLPHETFPRVGLTTFSRCVEHRWRQTYICSGKGSSTSIYTRSTHLCCMQYTQLYSR